MGVLSEYVGIALKNLGGIFQIQKCNCFHRSVLNFFKVIHYKVTFYITLFCGKVTQQ